MIPVQSLALPEQHDCQQANAADEHSKGDQCQGRNAVVEEQGRDIAIHAEKDCSARNHQVAGGRTLRNSGFNRTLLLLSEARRLVLEIDGHARQLQLRRAVRPRANSLSNHFIIAGLAQLIALHNPPGHHLDMPASVETLQS